MLQKSTGGNRVKPIFMTQAIHRHEQGTENKSQEQFWEGLIQTDKQFSVRKDTGK